jgi:signal-transduction protein with cAMP-binding, CBS, and nucleotidyltransferase domain
MQANEPYSFLNFLKKFGSISGEANHMIEQYIRDLTVPKKTLLLKAGRVCDYLYFIKKGLARNYTEENQKIITNDIVIDGELLTSFSSFVTRQASNENIELLEDSTLQALHYNDLQMLYQTFPELERTGRLIAEYHYNSLASQTHRLRFFSTAERYAYLFEHKLGLIQRAPIGVIASYLGMSNENLSRIRGR